MNIWRISKFYDLGGRGGLATSGRWHTRPQPLVYCSDEPCTAYREVLRHVGLPELLPDNNKLLKIHCPDDVTIEAVDVSSLDALWSSTASGWQICRPIGDEWLRSGRSVLLKVPSAARLGHSNYLINPAAWKSESVKVVDIIAQPFGPDVTG